MIAMRYNNQGQIQSKKREDVKSRLQLLVDDAGGFVPPNAWSAKLKQKIIMLN